MSEIEYSTNEETLTNDNNHPLVAKVLQCIGTRVIATIEDWGDGDISVAYEFPDEVTDIGVIGDDSIGAVVGAFMNEGNLIVIANYGDDGDFEYNINRSTDSVPLGIVKLELL